MAERALASRLRQARVEGAGSRSAAPQNPAGHGIYWWIGKGCHGRRRRVPRPKWVRPTPRALKSWQALTRSMRPRGQRRCVRVASAAHRRRRVERRRIPPRPSYSSRRLLWRRAGDLLAGRLRLTVPTADGAVLFQLNDPDHLLHHVPPVVDRTLQFQVVVDVLALCKLGLCSLAHVVQSQGVVASNSDDPAVQVAHLSTAGGNRRCCKQKSLVCRTTSEPTSGCINRPGGLHTTPRAPA
eukprot:scaffold2063_cov114-Isochrysis_galbana.AAC.2